MTSANTDFTIMFQWKVKRRVVLQELFSDRALIRQTFTLFDGGEIPLAEFVVYIMDSAALEAGISDEKLLLAGAEGLGKMMRDIFGEIDREQMLGFVSRQAGRLKPAKVIYWVEGVRVYDDSQTAEVVKAFVYGLEKRLLKYRGLLIFGVYEGVDLFPVLDGIGFRSIRGMGYRFVGKPGRVWEVRFEVYLPGFFLMGGKKMC